MNMSIKFYLGVALAIGGIVLMSLPEKACKDCEDGKVPYIEVIDGEEVIAHREADGD